MNPKWNKIVILLDDGSHMHYTPETEENNYVEPEPEPVRSHGSHYSDQSVSTPSPNDNIERNDVISTSQMCKIICHSVLGDYFGY